MQRHVLSILPLHLRKQADLVKLKFQANKHLPLATSPHPVGPSASSANTSTGQKPCSALYSTVRPSHAAAR
jgi:hypothetical protein